MTDKSTETVCVIIAAKDASATIARAVISALGQPEVSEVFVIDDGSSDDTLQVAETAAAGDPRLKAVRLPKNVGPAAARNRALEEARSSLVCVLDSDDFMQEGRIGRMLARFDNCDILADDLLYSIDNGLSVISRDLFELGHADEDFLTFERFVLANISRDDKPRGELGFLKPLMRRGFLAQHGLSYDPTLRLGEDYALYARALAAGARFKIIDACGYVAVTRENSLSGRHTPEDLAALCAFDVNLRKRVGLAPAELRALRRHERNTRIKLAHRRVLQAKSEQRYGAMAMMLMDPYSGVAVAAAIARDKMRR